MSHKHFFSRKEIPSKPSKEEMKEFSVKTTLEGLQTLSIAICTLAVFYDATDEEIRAYYEEWALLQEKVKQLIGRIK